MLPSLLIVFSFLSNIVFATTVISLDYQHAWNQLENFTINNLNNLADKYENELKVITNRKFVTNLSIDCLESLNHWADGLRAAEVESVKSKLRTRNNQIRNN